MVLDLLKQAIILLVLLLSVMTGMLLCLNSTRPSLIQHPPRVRWMMSKCFLQDDMLFYVVVIDSIWGPFGYLLFHALWHQVFLFLSVRLEYLSHWVTWLESQYWLQVNQCLSHRNSKYETTAGTYNNLWEKKNNNHCLYHE